MLTDPAMLLTAFMLGFLGSAHCLGMCGGLSSALGLNTRHDSSHFPKLLLAYNIGRVLTYCTAGLIVGTLGFWLTKQLAALTILRYLAAGMMILMGLYIGQWFNGIILAEKLGHRLWPFIQPLSRRFMPVKSTRDALVVGLVWGWLPCGLVYSALIWASLEPSLLGSILIMLFFGLGTLPSMLASGFFAKQLAAFIQQKWFRSGAGIMMIVFGIGSLPWIQSFIYSTTSF